MKNQHTPGPWEIEDVNMMGLDIAYRIIKREDHPQGDLRICHVNPHLNNESKANANLISACPDMFDALQAICDSFGDQDSLLIDQCKAALAKAKGESK
jgi:hypothetical protein